MKFFKIISTLALFVMNSAHARGTSKNIPNPVMQSQPIPTQVIKQPSIQQPTKQEQSYKDLVVYIKNAPNVWDSTQGMLRIDFVNHIIQRARQLRLDDFQVEVLLQTARDIHGIFSGNQNRDISILQAVDNQITAALRQK